MGVPSNTLLSFFVCQILMLGPIRGLPSSLTSIPPLPTSELLPTAETSSESSNSISNSDNSENLVSLSLLPGASKNCQLFIGSQDVNTNSFPSQTLSSVIGVNNGLTPTAETSNTELLTSCNLQSNIVSPTTDSVTSYSLLDGESNESTSTSALSINPILNLDDHNSSNFKRESRDTISVLEPCLTNADPNLAPSLRPGFTRNYVINSPLCSFPIMPSPKPICPCLKMPVNLTQASNEKDSDLSTNSVNSGYSSSNSVPCQCTSLSSNNLLSSQAYSNNILNINSTPAAPQTCSTPSNPAFQSSLLPNRFNLPQNSPCISTESSEVNYNETPPGTLFNALSSFAEVKNYIKSRQTLQSNLGITQNQQIDTNVCQVNDNLMYAKALQGRVAAEQSDCQILNKDLPICNNNILNYQNNEGGCEYSTNNKFAAEYENIQRIRNTVIPKLQLDNAVVKNIAQNTVQNNNDYNLGCPQLQTVPIEDNLPMIQNNNIVCNPTNNCLFTNNVGHTGPTVSFYNAARMLKDNLKINNGESSQSNNNQGCPQLMSIPACNRDSLKNNQIICFSNCDCPPNQNNNFGFVDPLQNNIQSNNFNVLTSNENNLAYSELLTIAQNKLYAQKCDNANVIIQDTNFEPVINCNTIQAIIPNENLLQAINLVKEAKLNQPVKSPAASINVLPFGQTLIDGAPVPNNFLAIESSKTGAIQSTCTDSFNSNNFLTIQDVSRSLPFIPLNQYPCCAPAEVPVNIPTNTISNPSFNTIDNFSPFFTNIIPPVINLSPSRPTIGTIRSTEAPVSQLFINNQEFWCNNNIQPLFPFDVNVNNCPINPTVSFVSPNFIPIQSLPQVSFVNNMPSSAITVAPTVSFPDNYISSITNLPPTSTSIQPFVPSSCINPLMTANVAQSNSVSAASPVLPCLNNIVTALTQNIISTLKTKIPSTGIPLSLPPVNPFVPFCLNTEPAVSTYSLPDIPVACNEYLPPLTLIPVNFNSDLFCIESEEAFDTCSPLSLSSTDACYPELSLVVPSVPPSDCSSLSGPIFMPVNSLPQSSSVLKINNAGREAKCYEQFVKSVVL